MRGAPLRPREAPRRDGRRTRRRAHGPAGRQRWAAPSGLATGAAGLSLRRPAERHQPREAGMTDPSVSESLVRVNYSETDQMGVAYHARYLVWLDIARTEHLRDRGASYRELEAAGLRLVVSEAAIRYRQPAKFDDL